MNEVTSCTIVGYDTLALYTTIWKLFFLNALTFGAIGGVALVVFNAVKGRKARRPYHV